MRGTFKPGDIEAIKKALQEPAPSKEFRIEGRHSPSDDWILLTHVLSEEDGVKMLERLRNENTGEAEYRMLTPLPMS